MSEQNKNDEGSVASKAASISTTLSSDSNAIASAASAAAAEGAALADRDAASAPKTTNDKPVATEKVIASSDDKTKIIDHDSKDARVAPDSDDTGPIPTMDDFLSIKEGLEPKFEGVKKDNKVEAKKEDKKAAPDKVEDKKVTTNTNKQSPIIARDYAGLPSEEADLLKHVSNQAFNYLKPVLLEKKKLGEVIAAKDKEIVNLKSGKQMMPDSYFEHPQAFVLSPEYNEASNTINTLTFVQTHWKQQMARIRKGEEWQGLQIDDKTGRIAYGKPQVATPEAEADVLTYLQSVNNQVQTSQQNLINIQNNFRARHDVATNIIKQAEKEHFAVYDDPKHPMQPMIKHLMENIPTEYRGSPLASLAVKSGVAMLQMKRMYETVLAENAELKKSGVNGNSIVSEDKSKAGPNEGDVENVGSDKASSKQEEVNYDDFEKVKAGL